MHSYRHVEDLPPPLARRTGLQISIRSAKAREEPTPDDSSNDKTVDALRSTSTVERDCLKSRTLRQINRTAAEVTNNDLAASLGVPYGVIKNATFRLADDGLIKVRKDGGKSYFSRRVS